MHSFFEKIKSTLNLLLKSSTPESSHFGIIIRFLSWQLFKRLFNHSLTYTLIPGVKVRCHPDSSSASSVIYYGLYEYDMMKFLLKYLRETDIFIDVGANIGVYSLLASSRIKDGHIYALEPIPKNYSRLQENLELNSIKNATAYPLAAFSSKNIVFMDLADEDCMASIITEHDNKNFSVEADTLDNLFGSLHQIKLIKLDAEGSEVSILKGSRNLLSSQSPPVFLLDYYTRDVASVLLSHGFLLYKYDAVENKIYQINPNLEAEHASLAIHKSCIDEVKFRILNKT